MGGQSTLGGQTPAGDESRWPTPQAAWRAVLDALASGDAQGVAQVATPTASQQLGAATDNWNAERARQIAAEWRGWDQRWRPPAQGEGGGEVAILALGPSAKEHHFTFRRTPRGWTLEDWQAGL